MRKMVEVPHASLTYQDGLSAVSTGVFGGITVWTFFPLSFFFSFFLMLIFFFKKKNLVAAW